MQLPLKTFWLLSRNIDRIMAQKDVRSMQVVSVSQASADVANEYRQRLVVETGTIVKMGQASPLAAKRDEEGFAALKAMA